MSPDDLPSDEGIRAWRAFFAWTVIWELERLEAEHPGDQFAQLKDELRRAIADDAECLPEDVALHFLPPRRPAASPVRAAAARSRSSSSYASLDGSISTRESSNWMYTALGGGHRRRRRGAPAAGKVRAAPSNWMYNPGGGRRRIAAAAGGGGAPIADDRFRAAANELVARARQLDELAAANDRRSEAAFTAAAAGGGLLLLPFLPPAAAGGPATCSCRSVVMHACNVLEKLSFWAHIDLG